MNRSVFITCAVTGAGENFKKNKFVPITPEQIANDALAAGEAGAAIVHLHVRDPETGVGSRRVDLYQDVVERIRAVRNDLIINLTAGMGGDLVFGQDDPLEFGKDSDLVGQMTRLEHVAAIRPDICTLDCGSYNVGPGSLVYISTSHMIAAGAQRIRELGVKPELELFELGHVNFARQLAQDGAFEEPVLVQLCLGVPGAAPATTETLLAMRATLPRDNVVWSAFGVGVMQMPMVAQAVISGGNVRVGLEDNIYLEKGVTATNAQLVSKAKMIIEALGAKTLGPAETRVKLGLRSDNS